MFLFYFKRSVLELVHENHLASVAIPLIYTMKRGYPPDEGAHLALSKYYIVYHDINMWICEKNNCSFYSSACMHVTHTHIDADALLELSQKH